MRSILFWSLSTSPSVSEGYTLAATDGKRASLYLCCYLELLPKRHPVHLTPNVLGA